MKHILLALICISTFTACKKEKTTEPETPVNPSPVTQKGNLSGKVNQYNQFGKLYSKGLNTTTVSVEGQTFTAVTDTSGHYTLTDVPTSTYTLIFKKPLAGLMKIENINYKAGDTTTYNTGIADIPLFTLSSASLKDTTWYSMTVGGIYYNATATTIDSNATVVAIIGKTPKIDLSDPTSYLNYATTSLLNYTDFKRFFSYPLLKDTYTFKKDSILYMKIYPVATTASNYYGLKTLIYTAFGTPYPTVFSYTLP